MAIDASGNALIAVTTASPNFPTAAALSPNYGFGGDIAIAKIGTASDLSITIESTTSETREGAILIFSVTIRNGGPAAATGVVMNGFVPSGTVFSSLTTTQGSCGPEGADHSIACSLGTIADGQSVLVVLQVRVTASAGTSISASAWLNADSDDLYAANNAAQVAIAILRSRAGQITSQ
jgi:uncharacterized repeat protein (TIGR01451 family)